MQKTVHKEQQVEVEEWESDPLESCFSCVFAVCGPVWPAELDAGKTTIKFHLSL